MNVVKLVKVADEGNRFERWAGQRLRNLERAHDRHLAAQRARRGLRGLEPELVVAAALQVLDEVGLEGLSIRAIAERIGVRGPALYWHFRNKQALLDEMAEAMLADRADQLKGPAEGEPWWDWLAELARWLRRALVSHRDGARVFAGVTLPFVPTFIYLEDLAVGTLHEAGFSWLDALRAMAALHVYVVGATIEEQSMPSTEDVGEHQGSFPDPARYPSLAAAFGDFDFDADAGFEHGLGLIIAGLRSTRIENP
ncbi:MAG: TetR/AcrR family transcriptional regulator C-terminal domain-containing protein [Candidatus Dormibacteraeota bacterium]|nr:TetR/AcrR family transcriptional regulator C-terminal domain-containing protein [Candidatus Dormibacteraeota bacterium]